MPVPAAAPAAAPVAAAPIAEPTALVVAPVASAAAPIAEPVAPEPPTTFRGIFREQMAKMKAEAAPEEGAPAASAPAAEPKAEPAAAVDDEPKGASGAGEPLDDSPAGGDGEPVATPAPKVIQSTKYQLVNAEGEPESVAWPEGITLELKAAGGKAHQVRDFDELASLAVQGIELQRTASQQGRQIAQQRREHAAALETLETEQEDTLLAAVFDDDFRAQLQEKLAAYRDPNVRKLASENRTTRAADAARAAEAQELDAERTTQLYAIADRQFETLLPEFPLLVLDDALEIKRALHQRYLALRPAQGDDVAAIRGAFNDGALREAMTQLNTRLAARLGKHAGAPPAKSPATPPAKAPDPVAAAAAHNAKVDAKLDGKTASRSMRGAGAPPVGGDTPAPAPTSWDEGRAARKRLFAAAAQDT